MFWHIYCRNRSILFVLFLLDSLCMIYQQTIDWHTHAVVVGRWVISPQSYFHLITHDLSVNCKTIRNVKKRSCKQLCSVFNKLFSTFTTQMSNVNVLLLYKLNNLDTWPFNDKLHITLKLWKICNIVTRYFSKPLVSDMNLQRRYLRRSPRPGPREVGLCRVTRQCRVCDWFSVVCRSDFADLLQRLFYAFIHKAYFKFCNYII